MWRVVKILLSGGIRGAEAQQAWAWVGFTRKDSAPQPTILSGPRLAGWWTALLPRDSLGHVTYHGTASTLKATTTFFFASLFLPPAQLET